MSDCNTNTKFKGVDSISQDLLLNILETNFKMFLDWGFLNIGGWFDATIDTSNIYGGTTHSKLQPVADLSYTDGQVWQGVRKDWVWETLTYRDSSPTNITGIYVNNTLIPYSSGSFIVDYPNGRIIFNNPISVSSNVQLEYSYRTVQTHRSSDSPWVNLLQYNSMNTSNLDIKQTEDGDWAIGSNQRVQMPCIIIEAIPRSRSRPYEIGNTLLWLEQDMGFYVLAENKNDRNKLLDIIRLQQDLTIQLFDTNTLAQNDLFPLDYNGDLIDNPLMYPDIVSYYPWRKCFLKNINLFEIDSPVPSLHRGFAKVTTEIIST
jgi:hypothetical protein